MGTLGIYGLIVLIIVIPGCFALVWVLLGVRRLSRGRPPAGTIEIKVGGGVTFERDRGTWLIRFGQEGRMYVRELIPGLRPPSGGTAATASVLLYNGRVAAMNFGGRLVYSPGAVRRMAGLGWGWFLAPFANIFISGQIGNALGFMSYHLGLSGLLSFSFSFSAYGLGLLWWILIWLGLNAAWIVSYYVRANATAPEIAAGIPLLEPALEEYMAAGASGTASSDTDMTNTEKEETQ